MKHDARGHGPGLRRPDEIAHRGHGGRRARRCGWVTAHTLEPDAPRESLGHLGGALDMRVSRNALWMRANDPDHLARDLRSPGAVTTSSSSSRPWMSAARRRPGGPGLRRRRRLRRQRELLQCWGEYDVPGTRPTPEQTSAAEDMTRRADHVVADSSYLLGVVQRLNPRATWIPDNVDVGVFRGRRKHDRGSTVRLVLLVGGVQEGAAPAFRTRRPGHAPRRPAGPRLRRAAALPRRAARGDPVRLRPLLGSAVRPDPAGLRRDPYGQSTTSTPTRWATRSTKITCGMAMGLPAVASPQPAVVRGGDRPRRRRVGRGRRRRVASSAGSPGARREAARRGPRRARGPQALETVPASDSSDPGRAEAPGPSRRSIRQIARGGAERGDVQRAIVAQNVTAPGGAVDTGPATADVSGQRAGADGRRRSAKSSCAAFEWSSYCCRRHGWWCDGQRRPRPPPASPASRRSCSPSASNRARTASLSSTGSASGWRSSSRRMPPGYRLK